MAAAPEVANATGPISLSHISKHTYDELTIEQKTPLLSRVVSRLLDSVYLHPVKLTLEWLDINNKLIDLEEEFAHPAGVKQFFIDKHISYNPDIVKYLESMTLNSLVFDDTVKTLIISTDGMIVGYDSKGYMGRRRFNFSRDDTTWVEYNPGGITLKNLVEAVYRMKGCKYDYWYETFGYISTTSVFYDTSGELVVELEANFGYGNTF